MTYIEAFEHRGNLGHGMGGTEVEDMTYLEAFEHSRKPGSLFHIKKTTSLGGFEGVLRPVGWEHGSVKDHPEALPGDTYVELDGERRWLYAIKTVVLAVDNLGWMNTGNFRLNCGDYTKGSVHVEVEPFDPSELILWIGRLTKWGLLYMDELKGVTEVRS